MPVIDTVAKFAAQLTVAVDKLYDEVGRNVRTPFQDYMGEGDASDIDYRTSSIVGFGQHVRTGEIGQVFYDALTPGRDRVITWHRYTLAWRCSDRLMRDAMKSTRATPKLKKFLAFSERSRKSVSWTQSVIAVNSIMNADSATATATWMGADVDGKALLATDHPLLKGGTYSNLSATALSAAAIQAGISQMAAQPDETGQISGYRPSKFILLIGPNLEFLAYQIMQTDQVLGSNNNDQMGLNKYKSRITVIVDDQLGAWDGWMLFDAENFPFEYYEGLKPTVTSWRDNETSAHHFKSEFEFAVGVPNGSRGMVGYPGT